MMKFILFMLILPIMNLYLCTKFYNFLWAEVSVRYLNNLNPPLCYDFFINFVS